MKTVISSCPSALAEPLPYPEGEGNIRLQMVRMPCGCSVIAAAVGEIRDAVLAEPSEEKVILFYGTSLLSSCLITISG